MSIKYSFAEHFILPEKAGRRGLLQRILSATENFQNCHEVFSTFGHVGSYAYLSMFIVVWEGKGWGDLFFYSDQAFNSVPFILNTNFKKG